MGPLACLWLVSNCRSWFEGFWIWLQSWVRGRLSFVSALCRFPALTPSRISRMQWQQPDKMLLGWASAESWAVPGQQPGTAAARWCPAVPQRYPSARLILSYLYSASLAVCSWTAEGRMCCNDGAWEEADRSLPWILAGEEVLRVVGNIH